VVRKLIIRLLIIRIKDVYKEKQGAEGRIFRKKNVFMY